jgi:hypothetical protein
VKLSEEGQMHDEAKSVSSEDEEVGDDYRARLLEHGILTERDRERYTSKPEERQEAQKWWDDYWGDVKIKAIAMVLLLVIWGIFSFLWKC